MRHRVVIWSLIVALISLQTEVSLPRALAAGNYNTGMFWRKQLLPLNLEVPIDMLPLGVTSTITTAKTFERSQTRIDTTDYDGTVTYSFEIIATNADGVTRNVDIVDAGGTSRGTITVTASTGSTVTRYRATFTPNSGVDTYRIKLVGTTANDRLKVQSARILIKQVGATKTRIYIPFIADAQNTAHSGDDNCAVDCANDSTFTNIYDSHFWKKVSSTWKSLQGSTPWQLEAYIYSTNAGPARIALYNKTAGTAVTGAEVSVANTSGAYSRASVDFSNSATNFTDGDDFELRFKNDIGGYSSWARVGIWVSLSSLEKGEVYYPVCYRYGYTSGATPYGRALIDTSIFSSPAVFFEAKLFGDGDVTTRLFSHGTNDSGTAGSTLVTGSAIQTTSLVRLRSGELTITSGNRFLCESDGGGRTIIGYVVVEFGS